MIATVSKQQLLDLADKWLRAGFGDEAAGITGDDLAVLGIRPQKSFKSKDTRYRRIKTDTWEGLCAYAYEQLTGNPHPGCRLHGRGFRSQAYGRAVAEAIRAKAALLAD